MFGGKLASLFVDIKADATPFDSAMDSIHAKLTRSNVAIGTFAGNVAAVLARSSVGLLAGGFEKTFGAASELNNAISRTQTILGPASEAILKQADQLAGKYGVIKTEYISAAAAFAGSFKNAGKDAKSAAAEAIKLADLGADLAARYSGTNDKAFNAIRSVLKGEMDPIEDYIVQLGERNIAEEAVRLGLVKTAGAMTNTAKQASVLSLLYKQTKDAQGALAQTAGESDNQMKKFWGTLENLGASIGQTLMPAFDRLLVIANDSASNLTSSWEASSATFAGYADTFIGWVDTIGAAWRNLGDVWSLAFLPVVDQFGGFIASFEQMGTDIVNIGKWIGDNWYQILADSFNAVVTVAQNAGANIYKALKGAITGEAADFSGLLDGFEATISKMPEAAKSTWKGVEAQREEILARMGEREAKANPFVAMTKKQQAPQIQAAMEKAVAKEDKFKSEVLGASDFASKLRAAQLNGESDTPQQQLSELKKANEINGKVLDAVKKPRVAVLG
mgnify:CR=1 FL=1